MKSVSVLVYFLQQNSVPGRSEAERYWNGGRNQLLFWTHQNVCHGFTVGRPPLITIGQIESRAVDLCIASCRCLLFGHEGFGEEIFCTALPKGFIGLQYRQVFTLEQM